MDPIVEGKAADDMEIENLNMGGDAFAQEMGGGESKSKVHIRTQQRNGRKSITTVQGLDEDLDLKKICKAFKKNFSCNGAVVKNKELGKVIQLQGDQRQKVFTFMKKCKICEEERMVVHGF
mmetsp:Transcript_9318/g.19295  ORF Transcript_9318/g.19295 Transcript_9318/m.19295 type:complete len:121 (+) Transcript_9318:102-464(+)